MTGEFNGYCSQYYTLTLLLEEQEERLSKLLNNAPMYTGQTTLNEVDAILKHYRKLQQVQARIEELTGELQKTEQTILMIMEYLDIPHNTMLTGEIPEKVAFEIWADDNNILCTQKIKDLARPVENANIITIKLRNSKKSVAEDDDD